MRIAFCVSSMGAGGAERVAATLVNAWAREGHEIILIPTYSRGSGCFYKLDKSIKLIFLADLATKSKRGIFNGIISRTRALRSLLKEYRPDVVVSFLFNVNIMVAGSIVGLGLKHVICERTDPFVMPTPIIFKLLRRITYPLSHTLVVQSASVAQKIEDSNWRLSRVEVIPNPISDSFADQETETLPCRTSHKKRVIAVGRLSEEKNFDQLLMAFAKIAPNNMDWHLSIVGEGAMRLQLEELVEKFNLQNRVDLPGLKTNICHELDNSDIFVLSSSFEGFPNALLEAMSRGVACITTNCPSGPAEITENGKLAILVPVNNCEALSNAIDKLMNDGEMRAALGQSSKLSVNERFSIDEILERWQKVLL